MARVKLSPAKKIELAIKRQFARRTSRLRESTSASVETNKALKQAALQSQQYKARRQAIARRYKGEARKEALAALRQRTVEPYQRRIATARNRQTLYRAALRRDEREMIKRARAGFKAQQREVKRVQARTGVKIKIKPKAPTKLARSQGYKPSARDLKRRVAEAENAGKLSLSYTLPLTKSGYQAYRTLMQQALATPHIRAWQYFVEIAGVSVAENMATEITRQSLWLNWETWSMLSHYQVALEDIAESDGPMSGSNRNMLDAIEDYVARHNRNPAPYIVVRFLLGERFEY